MKKKSILKRIIQNEFLKVIVFGLLLLGLIIKFSSLFVSPAPPAEVTVASGTPGGFYYKFANKYRAFFAERGMQLNIVETSGSVENIQLLKDKKVDFAFVQGGILNDNDADTMQIMGGLYFEPLWIISLKPFENLTELKNMAIAIGKKGSGTNATAQEILALNGISSNNVIFYERSGMAAMEMLKQGKVDAIFSVGNLESTFVQSILQDDTYYVHSMKRAEAYQRRLKYMTPVTLHQGVLDFEQNIPADNIRLVSTIAQIVADKDIHPAVEDMILLAALEHHSKGGYLEYGQNFPTVKYTDFAVDEGAARFIENGPSFLHRYFPFWAATLLDRIKFMLLPLITLLFPLFKILPPTYRWRVRSKIYKWYRLLSEIEMRLNNAKKSAEVDESIADIKTLTQDVEDVTVPNSYAESLYNLKVHIDLIRQHALEKKSNFSKKKKSTTKTA